MNIKLVFEQGDLVLISVFMIMLFMSVLSWSIILIKYYSLFKANNSNKKVMKKFNEINNWQKINEYAKKNTSVISSIVLTTNSASKDYKKQKNIQSEITQNDFVLSQINHEIQKILFRYSNGLTALASIGSSAPFIGLFGTVWGLYHALLSISQHGQVNIAVVSGPIGEALVATAAGLFVAIPATLAYNSLNNLIKNLRQKLLFQYHELHLLFLANNDEGN